MTAIINNYNKPIFVLIYTFVVRSFESPYINGYERVSEFIKMPDGELVEEIYSSVLRNEFEYVNAFESVSLIDPIVCCSSDLKTAIKFKSKDEAYIAIENFFNKRYPEIKDKIILRDKFHIDLLFSPKERYQKIDRFFFQNINEPISDLILMAYGGLESRYLFPEKTREIYK